MNTLLAKKATSTKQSLRASRRSLFLLKEIGRVGERLDLPPFCTVEYPDADPDAEITSAKYKRIIVHVCPPDGLYANGEFKIEFDLNNVPNYPEEPPKARMLTKMWHVNVNPDTGAICHNYLTADPVKNGGYTPVLGLSGVVNGVIALFFGLENASDPLSSEAGAQYINDHDAYCRRAKEWTVKYAQKSK